MLVGKYNRMSRFKFKNYMGGKLEITNCIWDHYSITGT